MFSRRTIPFIIGSILLVAVAFLFLTRALDWTYMSDLYKNEPEVVVAPPVEEVETVMLEVAVMLDESAYNELVDSSQRLTERLPQIEVNITNYSDVFSSYAEWERAIQLGELGDIQLVPNEWVVPLAIQGMHQPIDRLMNNDVLSDQLSSIVDALRWNGYMWALPYETNPYIMLMHHHAYEEIGGVSNEQGRIIKAPPIVMDQELALEQEEEDENHKESNGQGVEVLDQRWGIGFDKWMSHYEHSQHEGPFISIDENEVASLLSWLTLWSSSTDQALELNPLSSEQVQFLKYLQNHSDLVQQSGDLHEDMKSEELPFLHIVSIKQYFEQSEWLEKHYSSAEISSPLPWMNGKSFMLSSKATDAAAAMLWLEAMNRYQPKETLIHSKMYAAFSSNSMQGLSSNMLQQKLRGNQIFSVEIGLATQFEDLQRKWRNTALLADKLDILLDKQ